jgi:hypothetical protein
LSTGEDRFAHANSHLKRPSAWVDGVGDDGVLAFTDFGIETLVELIEVHKDLKSRAGA